MAQPNWAKIRARYERGGISYRDLAEAERVSFNTLKDRAKREGWTVTRQAITTGVTTRSQQLLIERRALAVADYVQQHTDDWQLIRDSIVGVIDGEQDPLKRAQMATAAYKAMEAVQKGQRLSLGLYKEKAPGGDGNGDGNAQPIDEDEFKRLDPAERRRRINEALRPNGQV
jgi:hypothetical protein